MVALRLLGISHLFVFAVPGVLIFTKWLHWEGHDSLIGLYTGVSVGYAVLNLLFFYMLFTSDWEKYAREAMERSEKAPALPGAAAGVVPADDDKASSGTTDDADNEAPSTDSDERKSE